MSYLQTTKKKTPKAIFYAYPFSCMLTCYHKLKTCTVNIALPTHLSMHTCTLTEILPVSGRHKKCIFLVHNVKFLSFKLDLHKKNNYSTCQEMPIQTM